MELVNDAVKEALDFRQFSLEVVNLLADVRESVIRRDMRRRRVAVRSVIGRMPNGEPRVRGQIVSLYRR